MAQAEKGKHCERGRRKDFHEKDLSRTYRSIGIFQECKDQQTSESRRREYGNDGKDQLAR